MTPPDRRVPALPTIRARLAMVVLACALPALLGFVLLIGHFYQRERLQISRDTQLTARALMLAVERDLNGAKVAALAMATSRNLATGDLAAFHVQASSLLGQDFPGFAFVLSDATGQQLVNTLRPYGQPLPRHGNRAQLQRVFATGLPAISDVYVGGVLQRPLIGIDVPVRRDGPVVYDLTVGILPERLGKVLAEQRVPPGNIVAIFDAKGVIVARTLEAAKFVGRPGAPALIARMKLANEGEVETLSVEGIAVYSIYSRSPVSGWSVAIGVPRSVVYAELVKSIAWLAWVVIVLLAAGFGMAWVLGGRISVSVRALTAAANALGAGRALSMAGSSFREEGEVASALHKVEAQLRQHRDHLEQQIAERTSELEASKALLETVYRSAPVGLCFIAPDLRFVMINESLAAMNGQTSAAFLGHTLPDVIGAAGVAIEHSYRQVFATGLPVRNLELRQLAPGDPSSPRYWMVNYYPVFAASGAILGINGVLLDITERKASEDALAHYAAIVESADDAIISKTIAGLITSWNRGAERMFGYARAEVLGRPITLLIPDQHQAEEALLLTRLRKGELVEKYETVRRRKDGALIDISVTLSPLYDRDGKVIGASKVARDITERKRAETALQAANEQLVLARDTAEAANRAKSQFLANMSHEIRTPMNGLLGMLQLLQHSALTARQMDYAVKSQAAARSLLHLLNDILDFSKLDAQKMALELQPLRIDTLLRELAAILAGSIGAKPVELLFDIDPALPACVVGDALRLRQVLLNLAGNAIKFTQAGEVVLSLRAAPGAPGRDSARSAITFSVRDTGIGVAADRLAYIFEGFSQAEASTTRRYGGTGLGLAISQRLVTLMGGTIEVASTPGAGSVFSFTLELARAPDDTPTPRHALIGSDHPVRLLIVDEHPGARAVLATLAQSFGWRSEQAADAGAAVQLLSAAEHARQPYQLLLIDAELPALAMLMSALGDLARAGRTEPAVLFCANEWALQAHGATPGEAVSGSYLVKPITASVLLEAVSNAIGTATPSYSGTRPAQQRLRALTLLVVEDNPLNQQVARELLSNEGATVEVADGGIAGVQRALAADPPFDAVLMDIQMPDMDGLAATRALRQHRSAQMLPIIAMTANALASDKQACLAAGMNDHIAKPLELDSLVTAILQHCRAPSQTPAGPAASHDLQADTLIERAAALQRLGGNLSLLDDINREFALRTPDLLARARAHIDSGVLAPVMAALHTLKGSAGTVGARQLADAAARLEARIKSGQCDALVEHMDALEALAQASIGALAAAEPTRALPETIADAATLAARFAELCALLEQTNMRAVTVYAQLRREAGGPMQARLGALSAAIAALDFKGALRECDALRDQFT